MLIVCLYLDPMKPSYENKRKQTTAVILLGVIGAEFGQEIIGRNVENRRGTGGTEGFGAVNSNLARLTSNSIIQELMFVSNSFASATNWLIFRQIVDLSSAESTWYQVESLL